MKVKTIPIDWIRREGRRLDSGPFMSGALEARIKLQSLSVPKERLQDVTQGGLAGIVNAGRIKRTWVTDPEYGVPFLSSTDILQADLSSLPLISKKVIYQNPQLLIEPGWTLITRSGTIGRLAYARPDMRGMACSEHVMRVVPDATKIPSGFLYAYLSSKFGVPLIVSGTYGSIIQSIEPSHIADLPVPRLGADVEQKVHDLVEEAAEKLSAHQLEISRATDRLFELLGISNPIPVDWFRSKSDLGFTVYRSELEILRAWFHSKRVRDLRSEITSGAFSRLGDLVSFEWLRWRKMFERRDAEREYGIEVITQKPLFSLFPEGRWISRDYLLNHSEKYIVPDETILIAKQGTLGENELFCRCEFITGHRMLQRAYSDHCMRIVVANDAIHPGYLFAFLRSNTAFRLLRSLAEGAKQQDLHWRTVPELPIPRLERRQENEIGECVRKAYAYRTEAIEELILATSLVEQAIEEAA